MKNINFLLAVLLLFFCACNSTTDENEKTPNFPSTQDSNITDATPGMTYKIDTSKQVNKLLVPGDTLLMMQMADKKGSIRGYLGGIERHVTVIVPVGSGDSIMAEIIPDDKKANIRFNQIYIPVGKGGKYDGPFSRKIIYPITAMGNYKLVIGENLMAEGDWEGSFTCNVEIR